jgi:hypothetical protein
LIYNLQAELRSSACMIFDFQFAGQPRRTQRRLGPLSRHTVSG